MSKCLSSHLTVVYDDKILLDSEFLDIYHKWEDHASQFLFITVDSSLDWGNENCSIEWQSLAPPRTRDSGSLYYYSFLKRWILFDLLGNNVESALFAFWSLVIKYFYSEIEWSFLRKFHNIKLVKSIPVIIIKPS